DEGLLEIDDVDAVPLSEDVLAHLRVPTLGLVPEMHTGLQELLHRDRRQIIPPVLSAATRAALMVTVRTHRPPRLAFRVLEAGPRATLAVLFPLLHSRVTCQEPRFLQATTQRRLELHQGPGDAVPDCAGLTRLAATRDVHQDVEFVRGLRQGERLAHHALQRV